MTRRSSSTWQRNFGGAPKHWSHSISRAGLLAALRLFSCSATSTGFLDIGVLRSDLRSVRAGNQLKTRSSERCSPKSSLLLHIPPKAWRNAPTSTKPEKRTASEKLGNLLAKVSRDATFRKYLVASYAENTKRAYGTDVAHFRRWGGRIPSTPTQVAEYLAFFAGKLAYATLSRRISALHREHESRGLRSPTKSELVRATLRGIGRTYTRKQRQVRPLLREQLRDITSDMPGAAGVRDRALLLLGFLGGFRRSELSSLNLDDLVRLRWGVSITIRRSKTDQEGLGREVKIPQLRSRLCAVQALESWLQLRGDEAGPLFVSLASGGVLTKRRLLGPAIAEIVKRRVREIGLDSREFSGHSLRAGFVTAAAKAGASTWQIKQQTGHKSDAIVARYIRDGAATGADVVRLIGRR